MTMLQQAQSEGACLHYPDTIPPAANVTPEQALGMLLRAVQIAQTHAFRWSYIDKPNEGTVALIFHPLQMPFPNDGIRYQEPETSYTINAGNGRELEITEAKSGFIPGADQSAFRVRRRFRLTRGGHPSFILVHYTRGSPTPIIPALMNQPVRAYPLRNLASEPNTYVLGEKQGQKVYNPGSAPMQQTPQGPGFNHAAQAALLNQNNAMEQLERKRERERERERRERSGSTSGRGAMDDVSDEETEAISTRTLALSRYKRNHELMGEVFHHAAFGDRSELPRKSPYSIFNKEELETQTARLQAEVEALQQKADQRKSSKNYGLSEDISMER